MSKNTVAVSGKDNNVKAKKVVVKRKCNKAVAHAGQRRKVASKAVVTALPIGLERERLVTVEVLKGVSLADHEAPKSGTVTAFGHKVASKAAACDRMVMTALDGGIDIKGLVKALVNADSAYGRRDTAAALVKRVHDHCAIKRNGTGYFGGKVHATRPHQLTAEQRKALDRFAGALAEPVKAAIKAALASK